MLQGFEALRVLSVQKTMTRAAVVLGITQSALSKRLARLEVELGKKLTERSGRHVVLTPFAQQLLVEAGPLLNELRRLMHAEAVEAKGQVTLAMGRGVGSSWGPKAIVNLEKALPQISVRVFIDGGPGVIEKVLSGKCMLGILRGNSESAPELVSEYLGEARMVFIPSGLKPFVLARNKEIRLLGVTPSSEAQSILERRAGRLGKKCSLRFCFSQYHASWTVVAQMACSGLGNAIVPASIASIFKIPHGKLVALPGPGLSLPVSLLCRRQTRNRVVVEQFVNAFKKCLPAEL